MAVRLYPLLDGKIYHIFTRSIAGFEIFRNKSDYDRIRNLLKYYMIKNPPFRFSLFMELKDREDVYKKQLSEKEKLVEIIAYCIMPTHIHLILRQLKEKGISVFMGNVLNSYTRYFNIKTERRGPLWESRFRNVEVSSEEQLLHLTRYIHLNPVTAYLSDEPHEWRFSSYKEFLEESEDEEKICTYSEFLNIVPSEYREFVSSRKDYQKELARIKDLCLE